ncbi:FHA domain-containing protein [Chroococcidiopsis sp. FACHB-1243]|uniref:FHA domain-containing protein n=1 Tax=Chroococcidiopsis sp. [FACHB-1243] TaxID=2692781 RepID=UPI00177D6E32|nr:FHA domain-containing protein [Chroococcidiopsis sp. [FACHB-1243]]MBD2308729.1 FHA domain-containing protein [Chroococcidiopsis sp. [FACHB-1243]]
MKIKVFNSQTQTEITELDFNEVFEREDTYLIGRSENSSLVLDSSDISRLHGKFSQQNGEIYYTDLGSRNGSLINGQAAVVNQDYLLKNGDAIQAGEFVLIIQETSEFPEDATVVKPLDAVAPWRFDSDAEVVAADVVSHSSALVKATPSNTEVDDPKQQTLALFAAINKRILNELQGAGNLTREAYLKAVRKARESIENKILLEPEEIEKQAEKQWQSFVKNTSEVSNRLGSVAAKKTSQLGSQLGSAAVKRATQLKNRLGSATKAAFNSAWREITTPQKPDPESADRQATADPLNNTTPDDRKQQEKSEDHTP